MAASLSLRKSAKQKSSYTHYNRVEMLYSGNEYFARLKQVINTAARTLHLQYYIFNNDFAGNEIATALCQAAKRGVQVYLMIDGYESRFLPASFIDRMREAGIRVARFEPLFRSKKFYVGRRMHHKIVAADGVRGMTGGVNIADRYIDVDDIPAWLDMGLYVEGEAATELHNVCVRMWNEVMGKGYLQTLAYPVPATPALTTYCSVRIRRNDWVKGRRQVWKSYFDMFNLAREHIVIVCSYFLPGRTFLRGMKKAVKRGVRIQVILAGMSDVMLAKYAERYLYAWMLRNGVEVYEYKGSMLHAKVAVRDGHWMTIGSYNVNNISAYASIELNADVRNRPFARGVQERLEALADNECLRILPDDFRLTQNLLKRFLQWCSFQLIRLMLFLATFYFRQERGS